MAGTIKFVPPRVPFVDPRTGIINREWYLLLQSLFTDDGGGTIPDSFESLGPFVQQDFGLQGVVFPDFDQTPSPVSQTFFFAADDVLPVIGSLRDEIAMLRAALDDHAKGAIVL